MRLSIRSALITAAAVCAVSTSAFAGSHASCPVQGGTLKYGVKAEPIDNKIRQSALVI